MKLPAAYAWVPQVPGLPRTIQVALPLYGITEGKGKLDNPVIIEMAEEVGVARSYGAHDEKPWCGLFAALVVKRAGWTPPEGPLWAANWDHFGVAADAPSLGDVMRFTRTGADGKPAGHVAFYIGEDPAAYHVLGGNQSDAVGFTRIDRARLVSARRPPWRIGPPAGRRPYRLDVMGGAVSKNEA